MESQNVLNAGVEPCYSVLLLRPFLQALAEPRRVATPAELMGMPDGQRVPIRGALGWLTSEIRRTADPNLGLRAASLLSRGAGDVVELVAGTAATFGDAIQLLLRYIVILNEAADFSLEVHAARATLALRSRVPLPRAASDFQMGAVLALARSWLRTVDGFAICFAHERPRNDARYAGLFAGTSLSFGAPFDAIGFDAALLAMPLASADPTLHKVLLCHAQHTVSCLTPGDQLAPRVHALLLSLLPSGTAQVDRVASELGVSRRTLTRRLAHEGTSFREMLEKCRHLLALQYLETTSLDTQEIAPLLGYSITGAFSRAFARWERMTPSEFRRKHLERLSRLASQELQIEPAVVRESRSRSASRQPRVCL